MEDDNLFLKMWDFQVERDHEEERMTNELMQWFSTIDILKHVRAKDISRMFGDGVLFIHVLRELNIPEARHMDDSYLLPSESFKGKLFNWKIINNEVLYKLNFSVSDWHLEFIAQEKKGYAEAVLQSLLELVKKRQKIQKPKRTFKREWTAPSYNYNYLRRLEQERVIWGTGGRNRRRRQQRRNRNVPMVKRYFNTGGFRSRNTDYEEDNRSVLGETQVQTYCFLAKKRNLNYPYTLAFERRNSRFPYRYRPGYSAYIYKYYEQFPHSCGFCNAYKTDCNCADV
ncbi:unnamed protein product [Orchesella dallaii]|uniref:CH-like domain-containing protein n=1 Tax=Orchesella dallaii TaxID=48710 RepID=A0ABP1Q7N7_9HEXA